MKIENRLYSSDFAKIEDSFRMGSVDAIELLPAIDLGFVTVSPMVVSGTDKEYTLSTRIAFDDPIGNTVCLTLGLRNRE